MGFDKIISTEVIGRPEIIDARKRIVSTASDIVKMKNTLDALVDSSDAYLNYILT